MPEVNIKPTHQIERKTGNFTREITVFDEVHKERIINGVARILTTRTLKKVQDVFTEGYMIYYPQGHSILVAVDDEEQLLHLELGYRDQEGKFQLGTPRRVDMESGETMPDTFDMTPKQIVERKLNNRPRSNTGGITAAMEA